MENLKNTDFAVELAQLELFTEGDPEQEKMLAEVFQESGEEALNSLRAHVRNSAPETEWKMAAHKLKGSSAQIGANSLSDVCRRAQEGFNKLSENEKQALLTEIEGRFMAVCAFFKRRQAA